MRLYEIVKALQDAPGSLAKQAILDANKGDELFKAYMKAVYDVGLSYYMKKLPLPMGMTKCSTEGNIDSALIAEVVRLIAGRVYTGRAAIEYFAEVLWTLDDEGRELLRLLIDRSIGASVGDTMVLKTWPDLYFIPPYMRCASMSEKARVAFGEEDEFYVQEKRDGSFAYLNPGRICTRQGSCYPDWFVGLMSAGLGNNEVLVGEMEVYQAGKLLSRKEGNGVLNSVLQGANEGDFASYVFKYVAWDCLSLGEFEVGLSNRPYEERLESLWDAWKSSRLNGRIELVQSWKVSSVAMAKARHIGLTAAGLEGSVWKRKSGIWKNTSSGTMDAVKVKVVAEAEFEVLDAYEGEGKAKGMLGGFTIATLCRGMVCNMGSGFNDKQRKEIWDAIQRGESVKGWIITAEFNDITTSKTKTTVSLSLPIFIEVRYDRTQADTLERVYEQFEAAKHGK